MGIFMLWSVRWSRKKSEQFKRSEAGKIYSRNEIKNKPILEQLKSKETWVKVKEGLSRHDPFSEEGSAIKHDVIGYLGCLPFTIVILILVVLLSLFAYLAS